jgi:hypothetical protein
MIIFPASGQSADTVLGKTSTVEDTSAGQAGALSPTQVAKSAGGFAPSRASAAPFECPGELAGPSIAPTLPPGPDRHDVLRFMTELGLDWHGATIAWCARRLPAFADASAVALSAAVSTILDAAGRFGTEAEIRGWYETNPVFGTVRRTGNPPSVDETPLDMHTAQWSADAWTSYDLTDAALDRDRKIHFALHGWAGAASLPLAGVFTSLSAVAEFAVESSTRAYCYGVMSQEDLGTVRSFQPLLEGIPEAVVVKRSVLDRQPPVVAILLTHQELLARPRASVVDNALGRRTDEASHDDRAIEKLVDRRIHEDLAARLREEAAKLTIQRARKV